MGYGIGLTQAVLKTFIVTMDVFRIKRNYNPNHNHKAHAKLCIPYVPIIKLLSCLTSERMHGPT